MNRKTDPPDRCQTAWPLGTAIVLLSACGVFATSASAQTVLRTHMGATDNESLGTATAGIGDIDGDTAPDYAVGSPYADNGGIEAGQVILYSGASGATLHTLPGGMSELAFGHSIAGLGDITGDGIPDLVVGGPTHGASAFPGRARAYSGADFSLLHEWISSNVGDDFADQVGRAGDLNGDGIEDIAIFAPGDHAPGPGGHNGQLYTYSGANYQLLWSMLGNHLGGPEIGGIAPMGDTNADGYGDLLVWGPLHQDAALNPIGRMNILSGVDASVLRTWVGTPTDVFGYAATSLEDANGDGICDAAMVSRYETTPGTFVYGLWLFSGADGQVLAHAPNQPEAISYQSFKGLGDMTGDGVPDFVSKVQAFPERFQVRSSADLQVRYEILAQGQGEQSLASPSFLGDINGDGIAEWTAGAPLQGS
ncbi:MAG: FG-GAP repeat protein, partial [Planctomycetes bacterium]|nr:FG-GAP repeat protein [Planctomycetota bacterium]